MSKNEAVAGYSADKKPYFELQAPNGSTVYFFRKDDYSGLFVGVKGLCTSCGYDIRNGYDRTSARRFEEARRSTATTFYRLNNRGRNGFLVMNVLDVPAFLEGFIAVKGNSRRAKNKRDKARECLKWWQETAAPNIEARQPELTQLYAIYHPRSLAKDTPSSPQVTDNINIKRLETKLCFWNDFNAPVETKRNKLRIFIDPASGEFYATLYSLKCCCWKSAAPVQYVDKKCFLSQSLSEIAVTIYHAKCSDIRCNACHRERTLFIAVDNVADVLLNIATASRPKSHHNQTLFKEVQDNAAKILPWFQTEVLPAIERAKAEMSATAASDLTEGAGEETTLMENQTEKKYTVAEFAAAFSEIAAQKNKLTAVGMPEADAEDYAFRLYEHDTGTDFSAIAKRVKEILK